MTDDSLNILIDIRPLQCESGFRGVGVYIKRLLLHLSKIDRKNRYRLMFYEGLPMPEIHLENGENFSNFPITPLKGPLSRFALFLESYTLPSVLKKLNPDVIHFTNPMELYMSCNAGGLKNRTVVTLYDLTPYYFKDRIFTGKRKLLWPLYRWKQKRLARAARIMAISNHSKQNLIDVEKIPEERITVTRLGVDRERPEDRGDFDEDVFHKPLFKHEYLLYVGACPPQKNVDIIIEILPELCKKNSGNPGLVIAGRVHKTDRERLQRLAAKKGVETNLHFTGYVSRGTLNELYKRAGCVVFPSLYEGFGFPALEAMKAGTPLVASNSSSIPEVVGDAGILADPHNKEEWIDGVNRVLNAPDTAEALVKKGKERAKEFTWEKTARKTLEVYKQIAANQSNDLLQSI